MTDLQLGLLVLGAVAVVGVVLYNRLQERAVRREAERAFATRHADVLLGDLPRQGLSAGGCHVSAERLHQRRNYVVIGLQGILVTGVLG